MQNAILTIYIFVKRVCANLANKNEKHRVLKELLLDTNTKNSAAFKKKSFNVPSKMRVSMLFIFSGSCLTGRESADPGKVVP